MTVEVEATAIVLCGGKTTRFGGDKALASVGGRPVIDRVIDAVGPLCSRVIVVTSQDRPDLQLPPGVRVVADTHPGHGPLGGICTGLRHTPTDLALVVGCDMPFLNPGVLRLMLDRLTWFDAVVPRHGDGYLEPLHAVYTRGCLPPMEAHLASGRLALWDVLQELHARYLEEAECRPLDPELLSFFNLNSPADLKRAERIAAEVAQQTPPE
jgi:molybdopterin-guanine dinucleotide biosynthesis protein A